MSNDSASDIQLSSSAPSSSHQSLYKHNGVSTNVLHQKHREETIELRKKKRDDGFSRARRLVELSRDQAVEPELRSVFDQQLIADLTSGENDRVFSALQTYSRLFSSPECVDQMHEIELVNVIVDIFMGSAPLSDMEAICIIVLSKLDQISCFLNSGVIAKLVNSLGSQNLEAVEHAVFVLEEIVRHDPYTRSTCDSLQIIPTSISLYLKYDHLNLRRQILTMMSNYFEYEALIHDITKELLDFLHFILLNEADELLLSDVFDILVKIAQFSRSHADLLITEGFLSEAIQFLEGDISNLCMSLVKVIAACGEEHIKVLSDLGYFEKVWDLANSTSNLSKKRGIAYEVVGIFIKNGYLRLNPNSASTITGRLIENLNESAFEVRRQTLFAIEQLLNVCSDTDILIQFTQSSCLGSLCDLLTTMHVETVLRSINCLDKIMDYGVANGIDVELRTILESHNAREKFDFLTNSQSYEVFKKADAFINIHLSDESGDELDLRCD